MKMILVVAAVILEGAKILCVQRPQSKHSYISKKFEFPGGKVENGETHHQALVREIKEELNLTIVISKPFLAVEHEYPDFAITMHSYICSTSEPQLMKLHEHIDYKWVPIDGLDQLDWAEADTPIVEKLKKCAHEQFR